MTTSTLPSRPLHCDVLEDDPAVSEVICGILRRNGATYRSFSRLDEHLEALKETHPDVVFLDVRLAEADAVEAIRRYNSLDYRGYIQVVSGLDMARLFEIYKMSERYGYRALYPIGKPFRSDAIRSVLGHVQASLALVQETRPEAEASIQAGWLSGLDRSTPTALFVQPQLLIGTGGADLAANPGVLASLVAATRAGSGQIAGAADIWVLLGVSTALTSAVRDLVPQAGEAQTQAARLIVPLAEATADPEAFGDLRTRLSVYGIALGVFANRLEDVSLSTLSTAGADAFLVGEGMVEQVMASAAGRHLAERVLSACQRQGMALVAACAPKGEAGLYFASIGVTGFAPQLADMVPPERLADLPMPDMPAPESAAAPDEVLPLRDFSGRHLLSERELEIVQLTVAGHSAKEAGRALGLSYRTVEVHRANVFAKLGLKNVAQLTRLVLASN